MKIKHIDRYYSDIAGYTFIIIYENGDGEQVPGFEALSKEQKQFIAAAPNFEFMKTKGGRYFHRFS